MVIGTQFEGDRSPNYYQHLKQLGVDHICSNPPGKASTWTADILSAHREKMESHGLALDLIPLAHIGLARNDEFPAIMLEPRSAIAKSIKSAASLSRQRKRASQR